MLLVRLAVAIGLTDPIRSVVKLIETARDTPTSEPLPVEPQERPRLRLIRDGRAA